MLNLTLPLHHLWILSTYHDIAKGWQTGNMYCLLAKAKMTEEETDR